MTVADLLRLLGALPPETPVLLGQPDGTLHAFVVGSDRAAPSEAGEWAPGRPDAIAVLVIQRAPGVAVLVTPAPKAVGDVNPVDPA
ncbi:MAG: hypothetical protein ACOZNI_12970 [Myxococcota bacterium]